MSLNKILTLSQELRKNGFDKQADELEYKFIVLNKFKTINKTASMTKSQLVDIMVEYFKDKTRYSPEALKSMCSNLSYDQLNNFNEKLFENDFAGGAAPRLSDYFGSGAARGAAHVGGTPSATPSPSLPTPHGSPHSSPEMRDGVYIVKDKESALEAIEHMKADSSVIPKYKNDPNVRALIDRHYGDHIWSSPVHPTVGLKGSPTRTRSWIAGGLGAAALVGLSLMGDDDEVPQVSTNAPNKPEPKTSNKPKPDNTPPKPQASKPQATKPPPSKSNNKSNIDVDPNGSISKEKLQ